MADREGTEIFNSKNVKIDSLDGDEDVKNDKKRKPGIVFLSTLPPYMNVTKVREIFNNFGEVDRIFLQPVESKGKKKRKRPSLHFEEGWIEFKSKRIAKEVAAKLNNTQIGGKKTSKWYDYTWNLKYLPRFKWAYLGERLAYERAVHKQRLRAEIAQAKREANHFSATLEMKRRRLGGEDVPENSIQLRPTEDESHRPEDRTEFLKSLFA